MNKPWLLEIRNLKKLKRTPEELEDEHVSDWADKDGVMISACFELLLRFVDDEYDGIEGIEKAIKGQLKMAYEGYQEEEPNSRDLCLHWAYALMEIKNLYIWWKDFLELESKDIEGLSKEEQDKYFDEVHKEEEQFDRNLDRLMRVRKNMWT